MLSLLNIQRLGNDKDYQSDTNINKRTAFK